MPELELSDIPVLLFAACVTIIDCVDTSVPDTCNVSVRALEAVFARTDSFTVAFPVPDSGFRVIQVWLLLSVHEVFEVTVNVDEVLAVAATSITSGVTDKVNKPDSCVTIIVWEVSPLTSMNSVSILDLSV